MKNLLKIDAVAEGKHDGAVVALIEEITQRGETMVITEVKLDIHVFVANANGNTQVEGLHERFVVESEKFMSKFK